LVKKEESKSMRDVTLEEIKEYAAEDADVTFQLKELFAVELEKTQTNKLFEDIEIPLVPVLAAMETEGINLDVPFLKSMSGEMQKRNRHFRTKKYMKLQVRIQPHQNN
jgi:DNA polymerase-1